MTLPELVQRIKEARESAGLSQAAAAKLAGVSQVFWWKFEAGQKGATPEVLARMGDAVGLEIEAKIVEPSYRVRKKNPKK